MWSKLNHNSRLVLFNVVTVIFSWQLKLNHIAKQVLVHPSIHVVEN